MSPCGVVMLSDDKCPVLAGDCGDISQSPRLQLVAVLSEQQVHHLTRSHRREAANEKQVNQFYQTFYLSHILFLFVPVWALNAATLATDAHMARHLRCWCHCSQLTLMKVFAHFCFLDCQFVAPVLKLK